MNNIQRTAFKLVMRSRLGSSSVKKPNDLSRNASRRLFSANEVKTMEETALKAEETIVCVVRHGEGDRVVTLNVGGKEFITLRSTIQNNPVLFNRVTQAEANQEFYKGAVYIDRDPTYFHLILQHLRNRADLMSSNSRWTSINPRISEKAHKILFKKKDVLIQIPEKKDALRDLYVEARYFQIGELESLLCAMDWHTRFASWFGTGATNPFYAASQAVTAVRSTLLATSGVGIAIGTQNQELVENIKGFFRDVYAVVRGGKSSEGDQATNVTTKDGSTKSSRGLFTFS